MALVKLKSYSHYLGMEMPMTVILPDKHYHDTVQSDTYPVLYLLHGHADDQTSWIRNTEIEEYVKSAGVIVAMPCAHRSFYTNAVHGLPYEDYIAKEVPFVIHEYFHASDKTEDQYIAGVSMGGYGAMKIGFKYPEKFGHIASMSGLVNYYKYYMKDAKAIVPADFDAHMADVFGSEKQYYGSENDLRYLAEKLSIRTDVRHPDLFMTCGKEDFLYQSQELFVKFLHEKTDLKVTFKAAEGIHNWKFWNQEIPEVLRYFGFLPESI